MHFSAAATLLRQTSSGHSANQGSTPFWRAIRMQRTERAGVADKKSKAGNGMSPLKSLEKRVEELNLRLSRLEQPESQTDDQPSHSTFLREIRRLRDYRNALFDGELFGEPAWDILLQLYGAELEGKPLIVSKVGRASSVSPTTALRWVDRLEAGGWLERVPDPKSRKRIFVVLTAPASKAMRSYLVRVQSGQLPV